MFVPHRNKKYGSQRPVTGIALLFLYADDVRTSQGTLAFTVGYGDNFDFYMNMMFVPHRKHMYRPPQTVKGITIHCYM
jgi:hypothetical protein